MNGRRLLNLTAWSATLAAFLLFLTASAALKAYPELNDLEVPALESTDGMAHMLQAPLPDGARPGYLIVAPETLTSGEVLNEFVAFKSGLGFDVHVQSIDWIVNNVPGNDVAERLRNYLQMAYEANTSGPRNIRYALLVGNKDEIPFRQVYPRWPDSEGQTLSDWYYADLTGDWDSNANGRFAEGILLDDPTDEADLHYEVAIGRLPFSHQPNVELALDTIMAFERDGGEWKTETILAGAFMQFAGLKWSPVDDPQGAYHAFGIDTDNATLMERIWNDILQPEGMSRTRLYETSLNANGVPHSSYVADFPLSLDDLVDVWNEERHGLVNLAGHGNEWAVYQTHWYEDIDDDDTINDPTRPIDTGDGRLRSRRELSSRAFLAAHNLSLLEPPDASTSVVAAAGCGTANASSGNGLGVNFLALGKASAFFGSLGTTGFEPAWAENTGKGVMQDILLRFNRVLTGAYPRVGDAAYQTTMQLFDEAPGEPRGRALVKHVLYGDPAMSFWGAGAEFEGPWPMFRHDIRNSGMTSYDGPALGTVRWTFPLNPVPFDNGTPSPIVGPDGTIYAGSAQGTLYAVNPDGTEKWHFQAGGAVNAGPILTLAGSLYFRADDGYLYAVKNDGTFLWRQPMELIDGTAGPTPGQPPFSNAPRVLPEGTVIALATIDVGAGSHAIYNGYRPDGQRVWAQEFDHGAAGTPAIGSAGDIYFLLWDGSLNTGFDLEAPSLGSAAVGTDGSIYAGTINGRLYSIGPDMQENWHYQIAGTLNDINSSPALGEDGSVYFGASDHHIYALNWDGSLRWKYDTTGAVDSSPALDDSTVYVVGGPTLNARLYALDRSDGDLRWSANIGGRSDWGSSPAIGYGKMVYVISQDGRLFAIGPAAPLPPSDALAQPFSPFRIDITWRDNSNDEGGFQLERRRGWSGSYQIIATLDPDVTQYYDTSVQPGQSYFYRVLALGSLSSRYSNTAYTRLPSPPPVAPTGLTAEGESSYAIGLDWDPPAANAVGVEIYRSLTAAGPFELVGLVAGDVTRFADVNPTVIFGEPSMDAHPRPEETYFYKLRTFNAGGDSPDSTPIMAKALDQNLAPPTSVQANVHDFKYVGLSWEAQDSRATGFVVERTSSSQPAYEVIAVLANSVTSYEDHELEPGHNAYRVRAISSTANSPFVVSNTVYIGEATWKLFLSIVER